tara:strand:- start:849 stop:1511 length:663 start_codon:yes stop_codon:yes gene_type:complete
MKKNSFVIFWDWNGTIVDDTFVFVQILNILLKKYNLKPISLAFYKKHFCFPVIDFYKKLELYKNPLFFKTLNAEFIKLYNKNKLKPKLKPGVVELINLLNSNGFSQCVVSAQNNKTLHGLISYYNLSGSFEQIVGVDNDLAVGKKDLAHQLCKKYKNKNFIVVGDTLLDHQVAKHIGADCILVDWGHYSSCRLSSSGSFVVSSLKGLRSSIFLLAEQATH